MGTEPQCPDLCQLTLLPSKLSMGIPLCWQLPREFMTPLWLSNSSGVAQHVPRAPVGTTE